MRHRPDLKKVLLIAFSLATVSLPSAAQTDWISKIREAREKGTPQSRLEQLDKALKEAADPQRPLLWMERGLILESQGKFGDALIAYDQVLKEPGSLAEYAHLFAGRLAAQTGSSEKARAHFESLLALSPNLQLENEANFHLARMSLQAGKAAEARKALVKLEKKQRGDPSYPDILWELARAERRLDNAGAFCSWLKKLFIQRPDSPRVAAWGSDLSGQLFDEKPSGCAMSFDDRKRRIKNLQLAGQAKRAWAEIGELKKTPGEDPYELAMLEALYHLHEGEVTETLGLLLPYYEKKKTDFNYLTTLATTAARAGNSQLAVGSYYAAYKLSPRATLGRQALYQSAFLSYQFQDYDGASRRFQEFMKAYPTSGLAKDARWHLAWVRYLRGDYEGAYKAFADLKTVPKKGRAKPAGTDRIAYWMAMSQFRQGKYAEARASFQTLVKEGGQGYYALASKQRLGKIEDLLPKPVRPVLTEENKRLTRFSATELMQPADSFEGPQWANLIEESRESESEENLLLNPLSSQSELAAEPGEGEGSSEPVHLSSDDAGGELKSSFSNPVLVKRFERARDLILLGLNDWAKWDLYEIERRTNNKEYLKTLMDEYAAIEQFHRSASIAQNAFASLRSQYGIGGIRSIWEHAYPQAYRNQVLRWSGEYQVSSELVWGIMKAESSYKRDVVSPVGAVGLMQIMPNTGQKLSDILKEKGFTTQRLYEPEVSIRLGTKYLQRLMRQFDQNYALVAAGYNAGPHRVRGWLASFGQLELDEFIEHIPFLETRNYVKKVLSNAYVYNQIYGGPREFFAHLSEPLKIRFQSTVPTKETWEDI